MNRKTRVKQFLVVLALFTTSMACVGTTIFNVMMYRALFNTDYFGSMIANWVGLFLIPLLLIPPFVFWCGKGFDTVSTRTAARLTIWPAVLWLAVLVMLILMEDGRAAICMRTAYEPQIIRLQNAYRL